MKIETLHLLWQVLEGKAESTKVFHAEALLPDAPFQCSIVTSLLRVQ